MTVNNSLKKFIGPILILVLALPLIYFTLSNEQDKSNDHDKQLDLLVGFYICGEGFDSVLIDEDISDTLGLSSDSIQFVYLVDYDGFGNTVFFKPDNYSRSYLNISLFMPYDSTELDMGSEEVLSGYLEYLRSYQAERFCLIMSGHGKGDEGLCIDGGSSLSPGEINSSLSAYPPDLLIFDACEMNSHGVLSELVDFDMLIVGTEKDIPDRGLDYSGGFSDYIYQNKNEMIDLAESIMDSTKEYYQTNPSRFSLQISLISTELYRKVTDMKIDPNVTSGLECFESGVRVDLGLLLSEQGLSDDRSLLNEALLYQVLLPSHQGVNIDDVSGVSIRIEVNQ